MQKVTFQIGLKKVFVINKVKNSVPWAYFISDLNGKENDGMFYEKGLQETSRKEIRA